MAQEKTSKNDETMQANAAEQANETPCVAYPCSAGYHFLSDEEIAELEKEYAEEQKRYESVKFSD